MTTRGQIDREELRARARALRLVLSDNDGVLTDGGVYYSERGEELKRYSVRDGMGIERLRLAGVETVIVTREKGGAVVGRAKKLGIRLHVGSLDKLATVREILRDSNLELGQVAYIGDEVNDAEVMGEVATRGLTAAPGDAMPDVLGSALYHCKAGGGRGAFREFAEWILALRAPDA